MRSVDKPTRALGRRVHPPTLRPAIIVFSAQIGEEQERDADESERNGYQDNGRSPERVELAYEQEQNDEANRIIIAFFFF